MEEIRMINPDLPNLTAEQIEKHNHNMDAAWRLIKEEILVEGKVFPSKCPKSTRKKLEEAIQLYEQVLEINPKNWNAMWLTGKIYQRLGNNSMGLKWFNQAYKINPLNAIISKEALICAIESGYCEDAIFYARIAAEIQPNNGGSQSNLALAYLFADKLPDAKTAIEKALHCDPQDAISQNLGRIINHFISNGKKPPNNMKSLQDYWKKHG